MTMPTTRRQRSESTLTRRTWVRAVVLPPFVLGLLVYGGLLSILGRELNEHAQEPLAPLPDPCAIVPDRALERLFPQEVPKAREGRAMSYFQFLRIDDREERELLRKERVCGWLPDLESHEFLLNYPHGARGLHVELKQYETPKAARYVHHHVRLGRDVEMAEADQALLRDTEYRVEWDDDSGRNGEDESTSSIVARKGNVLVMVVFGQAYEGDDRNYSDAVSRRDGQRGITAVAERIVGDLQTGEAR